MKEQLRIKILFIGASKYELGNIFNLSDFNEAYESVYPMWVSKKKTVAILESGISKVNASASISHFLSIFKPERIVNVGLAGACNRNLKIGEVYNVSKCRFYDVDLSAFDYEIGQIPGKESPEYILPSKVIDKGYQSARLLSGDTFCKDIQIFSRIEKQFNPDLVDMEGASFAHVCEQFGIIDRLEIYKAPSDYVNSESAEDYYKNEKTAFDGLRRLVDTLLSDREASTH